MPWVKQQAERYWTHLCYKELVARYYILKPNMLQKMHNTTFCRNKVKYFYNAESKYRSTKK